MVRASYPTVDARISGLISYTHVSEPRCCISEAEQVGCSDDDNVKGKSLQRNSRHLRCSVGLKFKNWRQMLRLLLAPD